MLVDLCNTCVSTSHSFLDPFDLSPASADRVRSAYAAAPSAPLPGPSLKDCASLSDARNILGSAGNWAAASSGATSLKDALPTTPPDVGALGDMPLGIVGYASLGTLLPGVLARLYRAAMRLAAEMGEALDTPALESVARCLGRAMELGDSEDLCSEGKERLVSACSSATGESAERNRMKRRNG